MRLLVVSDLHVSSATLKAERRKFLEHLARECARHGGYDAICLLGDLAHAGQAEDYKLFESLFLEPLLESSNHQGEPLFFAVPGNHDVDDETGAVTPWGMLGEARRQVFFVKDAGKKARIRSLAMSDYFSFVERKSFVSPNTANDLFAVWHHPTKTISVICLNTAHFSTVHSSGVPQKTDVFPLPAMEDALRECPRENRVLILGHHPFGTDSAFKPPMVKSVLDARAAVYIHGHDHIYDSNFSSTGLQTLSLPGGHVVASLSDATGTNNNAFTVLTVTDHAINVTIHRWNAAAQRFLVAEAEREVARPLSPIPNEPLIVSAQRSMTAVPVAPPLSVQVTLSQSAVEPILRLIRVVQPGMQRVLVSGTPEGYITFRGEVDGVIQLVYVYFDTKAPLTKSHVQTWAPITAQSQNIKFTAVCLGGLEAEAKAEANKLRLRQDLTFLEPVDVLLGLLGRLPPDNSGSLRALVDASDEIHASASGESTIELTCIQDAKDGVVVFAFDIIDGMASALKTVSNAAGEAVHPAASRNQLRAADIVTRAELTKYFAHARAICEYLKYPGLASLGFVMREHSLESIYVQGEGTSDDSDENTSDLALRSLLEALDSLDMPPALKEQVERAAAFGSLQTGLNDVEEVEAFYLRNPNMVLVGDPGSGKSSFIQFAVLAYCRAHGSEPAVWHSAHVPITIKLHTLVSRYSSMSASEQGDLSEILSESVAASVGWAPDVMERLLDSGCIALFLDGLDEVSDGAIRERLVGDVSHWHAVHSQRGNRIVVTSRPSVSELVELRTKLPFFALRDFSPTKVRELVARLTNYSVKGDGKLQEDYDPSADLNPNADQLLKELDKQPRLKRLASNPLMLTLIVLVYLNERRIGRVRYRIYDAAVSTLVAVRGRNERQSVFSPADLRARLGRLAFRQMKQSAAPGLIDFQDALEIINEEAETASRTEPSQWLEDVAVCTGILIISETHGRKRVSFMHHSFLEYYAALGAVDTLSPSDIAGLVGDPRWFEVLRLVSGAIAAQPLFGDMVAALLDRCDDDEHYGPDLLLFVGECLLEADLPAEKTLRGFNERVLRASIEGVARVDDEIRKTLADSWAAVWEQSGNRLFVDAAFEQLQSLEPAPFATGCGLSVSLIKRGLSAPHGWRATIFSILRAGRPDALELAAYAISSSSAFLRDDGLVAEFAKVLSRTKRSEEGSWSLVGQLETMPALVWKALAEALYANRGYVSFWAGSAMIQHPHFLTLALEQQLSLRRAFAREAGKLVHVTDMPLVNFDLDTDRYIASLEGSNEEDFHNACRDISLHIAPSKELIDRMRRMLSDRTARVGYVLRAFLASAQLRAAVGVAEVVLLEALLGFPERIVRRQALRLLVSRGASHVNVAVIDDYLSKLLRFDREEAAAILPLLSPFARDASLFVTARNAAILQIRGWKNGFGGGADLRLFLALCDFLGVERGDGLDPKFAVLIRSELKSSKTPSKFRLGLMKLSIYFVGVDVDLLTQILHKCTPGQSEAANALRVLSEALQVVVRRAHRVKRLETAIPTLENVLQRWRRYLLAQESRPPRVLTTLVRVCFHTLQDIRSTVRLESEVVDTTAKIRKIRRTGA